MALIDLLLLSTITIVLVILSAGGYILMFQKKFSFLKRSYPGVNKRFSERLAVPSRRVPSGRRATPAGYPLDAATHPPGTLWAPRGARTADTATETMEIAKEFTAAEPEAPGIHEWDVPSNMPDLPWSYDECKIIALVRDPYCLYVYWEINVAKREAVFRRFGSQTWDEARPVLRIYDTTNLYFFDSRHFVEIAINDYANNWYIGTGQPNRMFCVELGRVRPDGSYILLARSNYVSTPRDQISEVLDEEWLLLSECATRLYERIGGIYPGPGSPGLPGPGEISSPVKW